MCNCFVLSVSFIAFSSTVQLRNNLTEKAFETRLECARQCVPFAFHSCSICVSLLPERIRERVPVTVVIRPAIIAISEY